MKLAYLVVETFLPTERNRDAHDPLLAHFEPHMSKNERRSYQSATYKIESKRWRKDRQRANKQRGYPQDDDDDDEQDDSQWTNFFQQEWMDYQAQERRRRQQRGCGSGQHSSGS